MVSRASPLSLVSVPCLWSLLHSLFLVYIAYGGCFKHSGSWVCTELFTVSLWDSTREPMAVSLPRLSFCLLFAFCEGHSTECSGHWNLWKEIWLPFISECLLFLYLSLEGKARCVRFKKNLELICITEQSKCLLPVFPRRRYAHKMLVHLMKPWVSHFRAVGTCSAQFPLVRAVASDPLPFSAHWFSAVLFAFCPFMYLLF